MTCHLPCLVFVIAPSATVAAGNTPGREADPWRSPMHELRCTPLLLVLSATAASGWLADRGLIIDQRWGYKSVSEAQHALPRLRADGEELDQAISVGFRKILARDKVIQEVIAGRLTLLAAAARFRALDLELPNRAQVKLETCFSGNSDDERQCRRVIQFVALELKEPSRCQEIVARLEAEFQAHLRQYGAVRLPEIGEPQAQPALVGDPVLGKVDLQ
jgi:hypothetical protein